MADLQPKAQPYIFDLGCMMCTDSNPLPSLESNKEAVLAATARDCAQGLINQLLTTCTIAKNNDGDLQIKLPAPSTRLPREKPVPKVKEKTKWERFAEKKGIKAKKRDGKLVYDEAKGDWIPKYGYKGKNTGGGDWLVEVNDKPEKRAAEGDNANRKAKKTMKTK